MQFNLKKKKKNSSFSNNIYEYCTDLINIFSEKQFFKNHQKILNYTI